jgi:DNA-binding transcriptional regulator YhcF (GntR family)
MKKIVVTPNGIQELELTAEEVTQRQLDEQNYLAEKQEKLAKEEQEKARKESAIAKLNALGLTQEEILSILK